MPGALVLMPAGTAVEVVKDTYQSWAASLIAEKIRCVRLPIGVHRYAGASRERALKEAAREHDLRAHQSGEKVDHGRVADQLRCRLAVPLWLQSRAGLTLTVARVPVLSKVLELFATR